MDLFLQDVPLTMVDETANGRELPKYNFNTETELCGKDGILFSSLTIFL